VLTTTWPTHPAHQLPAPARRVPPVPGTAADALLATAKSEVLVASAGPTPSASPFRVARRVDQENLRRGVRYRILVPESARTERTLGPRLKRLALAGAAVRTLPEIATDTLIIDRTTAVYHADRPGAGIAPFRHSGVVTAAVEVFERLWHLGAPLLSETGELPARERDLLSLLAAGRTDAAAAEELGVSVRTVRRLVSGMMDRLGARSRFMAGVKAAHHGWLPETAG
jgi:DNA-binding CsgD family transcriptional regulator